MRTSKTGVASRPWGEAWRLGRAAKDRDPAMHLYEQIYLRMRYVSIIKSIYMNICIYMYILAFTSLADYMHIHVHSGIYFTRRLHRNAKHKLSFGDICFRRCKKRPRKSACLNLHKYGMFKFNICGQYSPEKRRPRPVYKTKVKALIMGQYGIYDMGFEPGWRSLP